MEGGHAVDSKVRRRSRSELLHAAALIVGVVVVILTLGEVGVVVDANVTEPPWAAPLRALDQAVAARDALAASRHWQQAYLSALGSRRWEGMLAVGDAALAVAAIDDARGRGAAHARRAYLVALTRARQALDTEGVLRVAQAFLRLGDRAVAGHSLDIARGLLAVKPDPPVAARWRALADAIGEPTVAAEGSFPNGPFIER
jgi:hypothetical protein